jgi:peroxiredoxin family protein
VLSDPPRRAVIVTSSDPETLIEMARASCEALESGSAVRVFFRDESIPAICTAEVAARLVPESLAASLAVTRNAVEAALQELAGAGDARLYACSSSLYIWGVDSGDLIPAITGSRGLVAFLADDLAGAREVLTY